ncbi:MAG: UPF0280 family protein [Dehalococcoidales bacterium]|jgi:ApbE superfamily uncharacterized protein (UPF0280 family)|nr:UPF0280 family protein [Dehalococcoidales bacterium]MDD4230119.1 UPF0280 family protein [Dehalococcoidales bacterium]MDD4465264.1 UPF0280 family protein [Dehalococcoidales bacterium]
MLENRYYRGWVTGHELTGFEVKCGESDLMILADSNLQKQAFVCASYYYNTIREYINDNPDFVNSLSPLPLDKNASSIIRSMYEASETAGVGPMAAVAGAIAEYTGMDLLHLSKEIIVENGGDIFIKTSRRRNIAIYAGNSPLSGKIGLVIPEYSSIRGICTSCGTFGHSLSFGKADAAVAISGSAVLADAAATAIGNTVKNPEDINAGLEHAQSIRGIDGAVIIAGSKIGAWGKIELVDLDQNG